MPLDGLNVAAVVVYVRVAKVQQADSAAKFDLNRNEFRGFFVFALV